MKVCMIAPIPPFRGGIAKYCHLLARELERRHELLLLSYRRQYPAMLYGRKSQIDPAVDRSEILEEFRDLRFDIDSVSPLSWAATARQVALFAPDLMILPWFVVYWTPMYLYLLRFARQEGLRVVIPCINVFEHEDNPVKRLLAKTALRCGERFIVHSEREKEEILSFHPRALVQKHLLPLFEYAPGEPSAPGSTLRLLFFGCVRPYKGLDVLLRAMGMRKDREVALTIAGEFWYDRETYLKLIAELGISTQVEIIDRYVPDDELGSCFTRADVVVLPYRQTKTSGIIATAYGFGKPVLATDVGGFYEVVQDGSTGKIVPPEDPEAFAKGIDWFLANRKLPFGKNIDAFTRDNMSWRSLVDSIEEIAASPR